MNNTNSVSKLKLIKQALLALFLFSTPLAVVYAACCAGHGGVASCNKSTGHQMCKDGTASPSCTCAIPKKAATKPAAVKPKNTTTTTTPPSTTTKTPSKPKSHWWNGKSKTTTPPASSNPRTSTTGTSAKGCCSHHGGIAQCNKSTGFQMCKDGSSSATCACH